MKKKFGLILTTAIFGIFIYLGVAEPRTMGVHATDGTSSEPTITETVGEDTNKTIKEFTNEYVAPIIAVLATLDLGAIIFTISSVILSKKQNKNNTLSNDERVKKFEERTNREIEKMEEILKQVIELMPVVLDCANSCLSANTRFQEIVQNFIKQIKNNNATINDLKKLYSVLIEIQKDIAVNTGELVSNGAAEKICELVKQLGAIKK